MTDDDVNNTGPTEFSMQKGKNIIKGETDKRVSKDTGIEINKELEEYGMNVAAEALEIAQEDGRETVRGNDIKEALRQSN